MPPVCRHPVTKFSAFEPSVKGAMKLWHRCVTCGLPVLVKVYYGIPVAPKRLPAYKLLQEHKAA